MYDKKSKQWNILCSIVVFFIIIIAFNTGTKSIDLPNWKNLKIINPRILIKIILEIKYVNTKLLILLFKLKLIINRKNV